MKKILLLTILISSILSCTNASEDDLIVPVQQLPDPVTYNDHVKSILDTNCLNCHSNPATNGASIPLDNYLDAANAYVNGDLLNRISKQPGESNFMPNGGNRLPQFSIDLIAKWFDDGLLLQ